LSADLQTVVQVCGLTKVFGTGETRVEALKGIDLRIALGEFVEGSLAVLLSIEERLADRLFKVLGQVRKISDGGAHNWRRGVDDPVIAIFDPWQPLRFHALEVRDVLIVPPIGSHIDRSVFQSENRILVAAGINDFAEKLVGIDLHFVQRKARHVIAGGGVGINKAEILALQIFYLLIGTVFLHVEDRVIGLTAIGGDFNGEWLNLYAGHVSARIRGRAIIANMNLPAALAFDHTGIICSDLEFDRYTELL